jgi:hypothetical protein
MTRRLDIDAMAELLVAAALSPRERAALELARKASLAAQQIASRARRARAAPDVDAELESLEREMVRAERLRVLRLSRPELIDGAPPPTAIPARVLRVREWRPFA